MNRVLIVVLGLLMAVACATAQEPDVKRGPVGAATPRPEGPEWIDLLDAEHAPSWEPNVRDANLFEIKDSALHIFGKNVNAYAGYMRERLRDFALHVEFRLAENTNSGVILRAERDNPSFTGVEIQVLDDYGRPPNHRSCGALYDVATPMFNLSFPAGQWNSFDITYKGRVLVVFMNGWKVLDVDLAKMTMPIGRFSVPLAQFALDGYLFLQDHGGEVWYRNILLKKL